LEIKKAQTFQIWALKKVSLKNYLVWNPTRIKLVTGALNVIFLTELRFSNSKTSTSVFEGKHHTDIFPDRWQLIHHSLEAGIILTFMFWAN
jgi:hypothetical protein